jgi:hypothetical protein
MGVFWEQRMKIRSQDISRHTFVTFAAQSRHAELSIFPGRFLGLFTEPGREEGIVLEATVAADLAIQRKCDVQDVPYAALREGLLAHSQILDPVAKLEY